MDAETRKTIEECYGLLWCIQVSMSTSSGFAVGTARKKLLGLIDKDGQARGIEYARKTISSDVVGGMQR